VVALTTTSRGSSERAVSRSVVTRRIGPEVGNAPPAGAQGEPERDEGEIVQLSRRTGEDRERAGALSPAPRETQETTAEEVAGEVLFSNAGAARLPAISELGEIGDHEVAQKRVETDRRERAVERLLGTRLIEALESTGEIASIRRGRAVRGGLLRTLVSGQPGGLGSREPLVLVPAHSHDACLVRCRVQAEPAGRARRAKEAVTKLPRAEQLGAHTHTPTQLADAQMTRIIHLFTLQSSDGDCTYSLQIETLPSAAPLLPARESR
jgi:hypothetical protein